MIDKDRGLKLLGSGLGPTDVATALGCDPSFVSQWLMDDSFRAQVLAQRMEALQEQTVRDGKINAIEDELIDKLQANIQWITKPRDLLAAFNIVNAAKRRGAQAAGSTIDVNMKIVSIQLPAVARKHFIPQINASGEIVAVGEQGTQTASLQSLVSGRLQQRKNTAVEAIPLENEVTHDSSERSREEERAGAATETPARATA